MDPLSIYARVVSADPDAVGDIHIVLRKNRKSTANETIKRLREDWVGTDVHIVVGELASGKKKD